LRRLQEALTVSAETDIGLSWNTFSDIHIQLDTVVTHNKTQRAVHGHTTVATEHGGHASLALVLKGGVRHDDVGEITKLIIKKLRCEMGSTPVHHERRDLKYMKNYSDVAVWV